MAHRPTLVPGSTGMKMVSKQIQGLMTWRAQPVRPRLEHHTGQRDALERHDSVGGHGDSRAGGGAGVTRREGH